MSFKIAGGIGAQISFKPPPPTPPPPPVLRKAVDSFVRPCVDWVKKNLVEPVQDKIDATSPQTEIRKLGPGDSYKIAFETGGAIEVAKVGVKAETEVTARVKTGADGKPVLDENGQPKLEYVVTKNGGLNGGVGHEQFGAQVGVEAKIEMVVDSPQDAVRAAALMNRVHGSNPTPGIEEPPLYSPKEQEFVRQHTTAIELTGNAAVQLALQVGLKLGNDANGIEGGGISGTKAATVRFELDSEGHVTRAAVRSQTQIDGDVTVPGVQKTEHGTVTATVEESFDISPPGQTAWEVMKDVKGNVERSSNHQTSLTLTAQGQHGSEGGQVEVKISGKRDEVLSPEMLRRVAAGDIPGALHAAGDGVHVDANVVRQTRHGINFELNVDVFGVKAQSERTDVEPVWSGSGTASEIADQMAEQERRNRSNPLITEVSGARLVAGIR